jgi:acyl-CoA thioester hydrolase
MTPRIDIVYHPTEAAKLKFSYEIHDGVTDELLATGESTQVFLNAETNELMWENPAYIEEWKKKWLDD